MTDFKRTTDEPLDGIRIAWDNSSMQRLVPRQGGQQAWAGYPRIRRLKEGVLMAIYETNGNVEIIKSEDNGHTWSDATILFEKHTQSSVTINKANGELIQLSNGDLVAGCNYRPSRDGMAPFAIAVSRSTNLGETWTTPQVIYEAGKEFANGCWEPSFLELPSGELQVYFANEGPYTQSDEQEISMLSSLDYGISWSKESVKVSFRKNHRDGMPVPVIAGNEIVMAIEDNVSGQFKPYIVRTSLENPWEIPVDGASSNRHVAHESQLPDQVYAGAPYLMQLPSGELLLSYQTTRGRSSNWELSTMEVAIGDSRGLQFSRITQPFEVPMDREAKWNSISLWDRNTVVAASSTTFRSPISEVWIILGHVIPELVAPVREVLVDGHLDRQEWQEEFPVFVGHRGLVNLQADVAHDEDFLYFAALVKYKGNWEHEVIMEEEGVTVYIDGGNFCLTSPDTGLIKVFCNSKGQYHISKGERGKWINYDIEGIRLSTQEMSQEGYSLELAVPLSALDYQLGNDMRINFKLCYQDEEGRLTEECVVHSQEDASNTWCKMKLKP
ncbi:exo-alpha-sialidase [Thermophagus xiamenensis]|uniref:exo-alpha-sialidase n=1 Tax=Thermophagus xiamenensis TaxID=385682 RepID=UPI001ED9531C|nr:exo-alpha-sialidase [Thermophagus xiamenensis]